MRSLELKGLPDFKYQENSLRTLNCNNFRKKFNRHIHHTSTSSKIIDLSPQGQGTMR